MTKYLLEELGLEKLLQLSYSSDLVPSDYHLFWRLQNLNGLREDVEHKLVYFASTPKKFYKRGTCKFVDRWNEVLGSNGAYNND